MVRSVHDIARKTKTYIMYKFLVSRKTSSNPSVPVVPDITTFTIVTLISLFTSTGNAYSANIMQ